MEYPISAPNTDYASDGSKIGENIKNLNSLTYKINEFVNNKSKNIKFEIEGLRRRIAQLEE
jgi:c-di-GMP-related signal transduction protein